MEKEVLTIQECSLFLGVSESNIRKMMKEKDNPIPYSHLSSGTKGTVRFLKKRVLEWIESREVSTKRT